MSRIPSPKRCTSYAPGHTIHWIQALHSANKPEVASRTRRGTLFALDGEVLTVEFGGGGEPERFRNHDPRRLLAVARRLPASISLNDQYCILRVGSYCFSVRRAGDEPSSPCPLDELTVASPVSLADRVRTHGGFSVPMPLSPGEP